MKGNESKSVNVSAHLSSLVPNDHLWQQLNMCVRHLAAPIPWSAMSPSAFALRWVERDDDSKFRWMYQSVFGFACLCSCVCVCRWVWVPVFGYWWDTLLTRRSLVIAAAHALLSRTRRCCTPKQVIITQKIQLITIIWTCVTERLNTEHVSRWCQMPTNAKRNEGNMSIGMHNEATESKMFMFALTGWLTQFAFNFRFFNCTFSNGKISVFAFRRKVC